MTGITVIICCYNSAERLPATLKHLAHQETDEQLAWEIVLVDNGSVDNTREVASREWERYRKGVPLVIVNELQPGLSYARQAGIAQASYDTIIFCDDDNWLAENYLQVAFGLMHQHSEVGCLGGRSEAVADVPLPIWFAQFQLGYACGPQYMQDGLRETRELVWGAGLVVRKAIFIAMKKIGFRSLLSDRKGNALSSGGDSELCIAARMMGYEILYTSSLQLKHHMVEGRLTWNYLVRMYRGHARASYIKSLYFDVLQNRPLKKSWLYESLIRIYYFMRRKPVRQVANYWSLYRHPGSEAGIKSMWDIEKLLAHLTNFKYGRTVRQIRQTRHDLRNERSSVLHPVKGHATADGMSSGNGFAS